MQLLRIDLWDFEADASGYYPRNLKEKKSPWNGGKIDSCKQLSMEILIAILMQQYLFAFISSNPLPYYKEHYSVVHSPCFCSSYQLFSSSIIVSVSVLLRIKEFFLLLEFNC